MLTFSELYKENTTFSEFIGKLENRKFEFEAIRKYIRTKGTYLTVFSLPAEYAYEIGIADLTGKKVLSFGTDYNILKLERNAKLAARTGKVAPFITYKAENINDIVKNPNSYIFYRVDGVQGKVDEELMLPNYVDLIDLDYLGVPLSPKMTRSYANQENSFTYVNDAARMLTKGGIISVTFTLDTRGINLFTVAKTRDPEYAKLLKRVEPQEDDYFNILEPSEQHINVNRLKGGISGITPGDRYRMNAVASNEYINQIIATSFDPEYNNNLQVIYSNMYRGGSYNNSIMWRGVFIKK